MSEEITRGSDNAMDDLSLNPAFVILRMIETVDPKDTAKLDEIDARVWSYLNDLVYEYISLPGFGHGAKVRSDPMQWRDSAHEEYTRSRDALKAIRPKVISLRVWTDRYNQAFCCINDNLNSCVKSPLHPYLATEELAELHAIIQAIKYEREISA